jgi:thiamine kinase-like enzyme
LQEIKFISNLKGFSGCILRLYSKNGVYFVRKISKDLKYNDRLEKQMLKQKHFSEHLANDSFDSPKILDQGYEDDRFYFDMEYVAGLNLIEYISAANVAELIEICEMIVNLIKCMKKEQKDESFDLWQKTNNKLKEILTLPPISTNLELTNLINELIEATSALTESKIMLASFCHGDLTFENIVYDRTKNKFYLIDFLDSYIESQYMDINKIFQDVEGGWYELRRSDLNLNNLRLKMAFLEKYLKLELFQIEEEYSKYHYLLLAVTFSRILPYADKNNLPFIIKKIQFFLSKHESNMDEMRGRQ